MTIRLLVIAVLAVPATWLSADAGEIDGEVRIVASSIGSRASGPQEALVYLDDGPSGPMPSGPFEMTQEGKAFVPPLLVVPRGATVTFPNLDPILHNVFSVTPGDTFDLGLHKTGEEPQARLDRPGIVSVYCNIHPQMVGYLVVVTNPFFAHPSADGRFAIRSLPGGSYHVVAWFPFGQPLREEVEVRASGKVKLDFLLHERNDAGRHLKKDGSSYGHY
jgi:plastocyanin